MPLRKKSLVASVATPEHPVSIPHYCKTFYYLDAPLGGRRVDSLREQAPDYMEDVVEFQFQFLDGVHCARNHLWMGIIPEK
jgi:hypothetical protein